MAKKVRTLEDTSPTCAGFRKSDGERGQLAGYRGGEEHARQGIGVLRRSPEAAEDPRGREAEGHAGHGDVSGPWQGGGTADPARGEAPPRCAQREAGPLQRGAPAPTPAARPPSSIPRTSRRARHPGRCAAGESSDESLTSNPGAHRACVPLFSKREKLCPKVT